MKRIKNAVWADLWAIGQLYKGNYYPFRKTVAFTRLDAIRKYKDFFRSGNYDRFRRKKQIKAIRLYVRDLTKGEK